MNDSGVSTPMPSSAATPQPGAARSAVSASRRPAPDPVSETAASVQRCCSAYDQALTTYKDVERAREAFRKALPVLASRSAIHDFLACVAHGMVLRVFWHSEGPKLVIAAKVALATLPREVCPDGTRRGPGRPPKDKAVR